jgi:hypothetical protein
LRPESRGLAALVARGGRDGRRAARGREFAGGVTDRELRFVLVLGADLAALGHEPGASLSVEAWPSSSGRDEVGIPSIAAHRRALAGEAAQYEQVFGPKIRDGRVEPLGDPTGSVIGAVGIWTDVTGATRSGSCTGRARRDRRFLKRRDHRQDARRHGHTSSFQPHA